MLEGSRKRLKFYWTAPKNLIAILIFVIFVILIQFAIVSFAIHAGAKDPTEIILPFNLQVSLLYHFLPVIVTITLTACFIHLTNYTALLSRETQILKRPPQRSRKSSHLKFLRELNRKLRRTARKIRNKILRTSSIASLQHQLVLARTITKSAIIVLSASLILFALLTIAAYPKLVPTSTTNLFQGNTGFLDFVLSTISTSETIGNTIPPLGVIAGGIHGAIVAVAPAFRSTLEGAASGMTEGLVSLSPTEKYIAIQNAVTWIVAIAVIFYGYFVKIPPFRR